jgi:hypothetical protein
MGAPARGGGGEQLVGVRRRDVQVRRALADLRGVVKVDRVELRGLPGPETAVFGC